ncbi:MAG TPA: T9SS type A sorting domain-containing protein [Chitinophagaceae bacterium]|jgi:hypothetical protein
MKHLLPLTIFILALAAGTQAQVVSPITITGFNRDVVAETASSSAVTSGAMDLTGNTWYSQSFVNAVQASYGGGLPDTRSITSANNGLISYKLMPYNGNNALYMVGSNTSGTNSGTLTLSAPAAYSKISFLVAGTEGGATMSIKLKFSDNKTETVGSSISVADWFSGSAPVAQNLGRVSGTPGNYVFSGRDGSNNPRLYEITFTLSSTDNLKTLNSISFTKNDDESSTRALVFAVSGALTNSSLPVIFSNVEGKRDNNNAVISWQTQQESNSAYFNIERSNGNDQYTVVGRVAAAGNSSQVLNYHFTDNNEATAYYRICEVDADGAQTYSEVILVKSTNGATMLFQQSGGNLVVSGISASSQSSNVEYLVYNSGGAVLAHGRAAAGSTLSIPVGGFPKGVYILSLVTGNNQYTHRFMN